MLAWADRSLASGKSGGYVGNILSAAAVIMERAGILGWVDVRWRDARDRASRQLVRTGKPLRQARPADPSAVRRLWNADPHRRGLLAAVLFHSAARCSDWTRKGLQGSGPCPRDLRRIGRRTWIVRYAVKKEDPTGWGSAVAFTLPPLMAKSFRRLLRRTSVDQPLFEMTTAHFYRWVRRREGISAHSFRRGAAGWALRNGAKARDVCRLTGHKSVAALIRYAQEVPVEQLRRMAAVANTLSSSRTRLPRARDLGFPE